MLGAYLKTLRERAKLKQADLGELLGYGQTGISTMEMGRQTISAPVLGRWLDAVQATDEERLEALRLAHAQPSDARPSQDAA